MFKRVLLGVLVVASFVWVAYYAIDIASEKNNYVPEVVFSKDDGQVLVVVRPDEVNFEALKGFSDAPCRDMMVALNDSMYSMGFFSQLRPHMLLYAEENWNESNIKLLFAPLTPKEISGNHFSIGGFEGTFHKTRLYISKGTIEHTGSKDATFEYDKKASASVFKFGEKGISEQTDIYFKDDGTVNYITKNTSIKQGTQVKDATIFAGLISRNISTYHFYERDYYASLDETFAKGPMYQWMMNGFTIVEYDGERAIISDFIAGQDPILILNDLNQTLDTTRFDNPLMNDFPSQGKGYTVKYLEDLVVIAEKTSTCDKIIADYKLGHTIASSTNDRYRYYGELPKAVSERYVGKDASYSKSLYHGKIMETHTGISTPQETKQITSTVDMSCGFDIKDLLVLPGIGNVVALGKNGEVACFRDKKLKWKKQMGGKPISGLQLIDLHYNKEVYVLCNTASGIHLWDLNGTEASGFPVKMEQSAVNEVKFYRWKEKSYFLIADDQNKVYQYDAEGRELRIFKAKHPINHQIDIWVSQNRLFAGFRSATHFTMFEVEKRKELRSFDLPANAIPVKTPNQLFHFALEGGKLTQIDQKSNRTAVDTYDDNYQLSKEVDDHGKTTLILHKGNSVKLLNEKGIGFGEIQLPFTEIADIKTVTTNSGKTYVCIIDGLENNVYLYSTNGSKLNTKTLEGQTKVLLHTVNSKNCITTVVDQFVIQYIED